MREGLRRYVTTYSRVVGLGLCAVVVLGWEGSPTEKYCVV